MICNTKESTINARIPDAYKQKINEVSKMAGITQWEFIRRSLRHSLEMLSLTSAGDVQ